MPSSSTSGHCFSGGSRIWRTAAACPLSARRARQSSRSRQSQAWLGVPTPGLPACSPSTGSCRRAAWAQEKSSGGAAAAWRRKDSWPGALVHRLPTSAGSGKGWQAVARAHTAMSTLSAPASGTAKPGWSSRATTRCQSRRGLAACRPATSTPTDQVVAPSPSDALASPLLSPAMSPLNWPSLVRATMPSTPATACSPGLP